MSNPFDFLNSINWTKKDLIKEGEMQEGEYKPFLTNRSLSYHVDSVFEANEMNMRSHLPEICQYHFLLNSLPKRKRFAKFLKAEQNEQVEVVMEYFGYNRKRAEEALEILTDENIAMMYDKLNKGGVKHERKANRRSGRNKAKDSG